MVFVSRAASANSEGLSAGSFAEGCIKFDGTAREIGTISYVIGAKPCAPVPQALAI